MRGPDQRRHMLQQLPRRRKRLYVPNLNQDLNPDLEKREKT